MDPELVAYLDARIERVEDEIRQTRAEIKDVLRLLANGTICIDDKLSRFRDDAFQRMDDITERLLNLPYSSLECRVSFLETWRAMRERSPIEIIRERLKDGTMGAGYTTPPCAADSPESLSPSPR